MLLVCGIQFVMLCSCQYRKQDKVPTGSTYGTDDIIVYSENLDGLPNNMRLDSDGLVFTRCYAYEEFNSIVQGKSTKKDLLALFPEEGYFEAQGGHYSTIIYPLQEGGTINFRINHDDIVCDIFLDETGELPISVVPD